MALHWMVRLNKPRRAVDFNGAEVDGLAGQRVMLPAEEALLAADAGDVELLSPDAITAYRTRDVQAERGDSERGPASKRLYKRRDLTVE
jgi:hypothetical protein